MSNTQFAFIKKKDVPSREQWQSAINQTGFKFELDSSFTPFTDEGYLPCMIFGEESGFEIYFEPSNEILEGFEELSELVGDRDYCISFSWGGSMMEGASVMIACYALAKSFDATISYDCEPPSTLEDLYEGTQEIIELAKKEL